MARTDMDTQDLVLFSVDEDGIATLTLNRPDKYNAFTRDMVVRWLYLLEQAALDDTVKVLVLTGAGKAFCSGGDVGAQKERANNDSLERKHFLWRYVHRIALFMEQLDKPVIAAISEAGGDLIHILEPEEQPAQK